MANMFSYTDNLGGYYVKVLEEINSKFNIKLEKNNSKFNEYYELKLTSITKETNFKLFKYKIIF
jgi:hypothetical protein